MPEFTTLITGLSFTECPRWRDGRLYISDFYTHRVLAVAMDGTAETVAHVPQQPSGLGFLPDGGKLIVAESTMNRLSAFDMKSGSLGKRRTWAAFGDPPTSTDIGEVLRQVCVAPDGICLDAEGAVWVADAAHSRLLRVAEGGRILEVRKTDGVGVFACMLGGEDGRTLFASVAPTYHQAEASAKHRASVLMTRVEAPRAGLP
jgi:sugar lactone lactonase YvrE